MNVAPTVAHCVSLPAPRGGCVPRLQACGAGLDGTQKGCVSQPGACGPAKPVPRPLLRNAGMASCATNAKICREMPLFFGSAALCILCASAVKSSAVRIPPHKA